MGGTNLTGPIAALMLEIDHAEQQDLEAIRELLKILGERCDRRQVRLNDLGATRASSPQPSCRCSLLGKIASLHNGEPRSGDRGWRQRLTSS